MTITLTPRPSDTGVDRLEPVSRSRRRDIVVAFVVAVVAGLVLGDADVLLQIALPYPFAHLANSSAVWALAAFAYGAWARRANATTAAGGAVLLVVAVAAYYLTATAVLDDDLATLWAPTSLLWGLAGVLAGVVFGTAGAWCRTPGWSRRVGAAIAGAVCWAEAALQARRAWPVTGHVQADLVWTAVIMAVLGVVVLVTAAHSTTAARTASSTAWAALLAVPLAALGFAGFVAAGFVESSLFGMMA